MMKRVRVPRAMVVDFPPGCPVGEPTDHEKQRKVLREAPGVSHDHDAARHRVEIPV